MFSKIFPKIHTEGFKFLIIAGLMTMLFYLIGSFLGTLGLLITV